MPSVSGARRRVLKTSIDPQEAGYEVVLKALALILKTEQNSTQAGAVRRLLHYGAQCVLGREVMPDTPLVPAARVSQPVRRKRAPPSRTGSVSAPSSRKRAPEPAPAVSRETVSAQASVRVIDPAPALDPASEVASSSAPNERAPAQLAAPRPAGGLLQFRTMAVTQTVAPPEALAPRTQHAAPADPSVSPAALASTLARLKVEGREF